MPYIETSFDEGMYILAGAIVGTAAIDMISSNGRDASAAEMMDDLCFTPAQIKAAAIAEVRRRASSTQKGSTKERALRVVNSSCNLPPGDPSEQIGFGKWTSGVSGVCWENREHGWPGRWVASFAIPAGRRKYFPGTRDGLQQAIEWRREKEREYARHAA